MAQLPRHLFLVEGNTFRVGRQQEIFVMPASHTHGDVEMNYMLDGEVTYLFNGQTVVLRPGDLALFWAAIPHQTTAVEDGSRYVCVYVPLEMFLGAFVGEPLRSAILNGSMIAASAPDQFDRPRLERLYDDGTQRSEERMHALVVAEVQVLLRRLDITGWHDLLAPRPGERQTVPGPVHGKVVEMARFIAEHGKETIKVADVARAAGIHPNYAMTLFRRTLGLTINQYLLRHRMMIAQALLVSTSKNLTSVAYEAGFGSLSRFHAAFREHFGCTPKQFRRFMSAR